MSVTHGDTKLCTGQSALMSMYGLTNSLITREGLKCKRMCKFSMCRKVVCCRHTCLECSLYSCDIFTLNLQNILLVLSMRENTDVHKSAQRLKSAASVKVGDLDLLDKASVVRKTLEQHRKQLDESPFNNQVRYNVTCVIVTTRASSSSSVWSEYSICFIIQIKNHRLSRCHYVKCYCSSLCQAEVSVFSFFLLKGVERGVGLRYIIDQRSDTNRP